MSSNYSQRCYFLTFDTTKIDQVKSVYAVVATLNAVLILPTVVLNFLLIASLYRSSEICKPTTKFLLSLALSDVLVGLVVEPAFLTKKISEINHNFNSYCITGMVTYVVGGALPAVSFFTLTAIAIDRYLVIHTGTKYRTMATNTRVKLIVFIMWIVSFILMTSQLYLPRSAYFPTSAFITVLCIVTASLCYVKCFLTLRKYKLRIRSLNEKGATDRQLANACNYKKSMHTMAYVFLAFNLCYLPFICTVISAGILGESSAIWGAESIASIFIYGNSCINPVILFLRIKKIRRALMATMSVYSLQNNVHKDSKCNIRQPYDQCHLCRAKVDLIHQDRHSNDLEVHNEENGSHFAELRFNAKGIDGGFIYHNCQHHRNKDHDIINQPYCCGTNDIKHEGQIM